MEDPHGAGSISVMLTELVSVCFVADMEIMRLKVRSKCTPCLTRPVLCNYVWGMSRVVVVVPQSSPLFHANLANGL